MKYGGNKKISQLGEVQYYQMPGSSPQQSVINSLKAANETQVEMNSQYGGNTSSSDKIQIASFPSSKVSPVDANSVFKSANEVLAKHLENSSYDGEVADPDRLIQDGGKKRKRRQRRRRTRKHKKHSRKMKRNHKRKTYKKRK